MREEKNETRPTTLQKRDSIAELHARLDAVRADRERTRNEVRMRALTAIPSETSRASTWAWLAVSASFVGAAVSISFVALDRPTATAHGEALAAPTRIERALEAPPEPTPELLAVDPAPRVEQVVSDPMESAAAVTPEPEVRVTRRQRARARRARRARATAASSSTPRPSLADALGDDGSRVLTDDFLRSAGRR